MKYYNLFILKKGKVKVYNCQTVEVLIYMIKSVNDAGGQILEMRTSENVPLKVNKRYYQWRYDFNFKQEKEKEI